MNYFYGFFDDHRLPLRINDNHLRFIWGNMMFNAVAALRLRPLPAALIFALLPAAAVAEPMPFNIGAQPLASALDHLAEQSGLQVIYNGELVQGLKSPGVNGLQEPQAALEGGLRQPITRP